MLLLRSLPSIFLMGDQRVSRCCRRPPSQEEDSTFQGSETEDGTPEGHGVPSPETRGGRRTCTRNSPKTSSVGAGRRLGADS